jgi:hypothetical protein
METALSAPYEWIWTVLLGVALFFPARKLIWVLSVRREEAKQGKPTDEARRRALKRRAGVTSALLCFVFAVIYAQVVFSKIFGPQ